MDTKEPAQKNTLNKMEEKNQKKNRISMDEIVAFAKRRGFVFPGSELYGGLANSWDFGQYGVILKNNIKKEWWRDMVQRRQEILGIDTAILMNPKIWEASGHLEHFSDPMVDCKKCKRRFRADDPSLAQNLEAQKNQDKVSSKYEYIHTLPSCPVCGGKLSKPRQFNLMLETALGPLEAAGSKTYLRPETAQGIFVNFKNYLDTTRKKLPFGIAQIGKSFRNEITPGNFIFRTREFEQMEMEYFTKPQEADVWFDYWINQRMNWYQNLGVKKENLRLREHKKEELSHYAKKVADVEYNFPFGWAELEGVASRGDYDLKVHETFSKKDLTYFDEESKKKYLPYVIEPAGGVERCFLAFLIDAYTEEEVKGEKRVVLKINKKLSPIKVAVLPLIKKEPLQKIAKEIFSKMRESVMCEYDEVGSIGRRYRRQDEIGTPTCITVDFDSEKDKSVTLRDRDTMKQERVKIDKIEEAVNKIVKS